ncbi:ATP-binding protein [Streptomyces colonosanans]|uniref:ATP-binding protein n=1 Tax=Streptomyces colonosanans TaxID=1428652 RepID=A0A1S2P5K7_9ACTN|nr:ATP-binding protein [Streptomyces colonosanans]OIJ89093.1 ATP-binding protein [Streptomyces colonosanans]
MASVIPPAPLEADAAADRFDPGGATALRLSAAERRFRFELAAHPSSVARARHLTRARLTGWAVGEDTCDTAALVVSELVTNAIVHTAGEFVVCELHDEGDLVRIAVRDEGCAPGDPHPSAQRPEEEHGRGLLLVAALCQAWGAQEAGPGLLVWAELERATEQPATGGHSLPAQPSRDLSCSGDRSRATEDTTARCDLGWSAKKPPSDGRDSGAEASRGAGAAWV